MWNMHGRLSDTGRLHGNSSGRKGSYKQFSICNGWAQASAPSFDMITFVVYRARV